MKNNYPIRKLENYTDQRDVSVSITETLTVPSGTDILSIRLRERPSNLSGATFAITGTYAYTKVEFQPTAAGQYRVDWKSNRVYLMPAGNDNITITYQGRGAIPMAGIFKLIYMASRLYLSYGLSPEPGTELGKVYTELDKLVDDGVDDGVIDITGLEINLDRAPDVGPLGLRFEAVNAAGVAESSIDVSDITGRYYLKTAASDSYLLRLSQSHPYLRVSCIGAESGAAGIHIRASVLEVI